MQNSVALGSLVTSPSASGALRQPRLEQLDAMRGIAAVAVVIYHYTQFLHDRLGVAGPSWARAARLYPFDIGAHGVALFFVLSGFVILMTLDRTRTAKDFLVSRAARLYPAFWAAMLFTAGFRVFVGSEHVSAATLLANVTMVPEWFGQPFVEGVYWTLVVELQFYALMLLAWRLRWLPRIEWVCVGWLGLLAAAQVGARLGLAPSALELLSVALILRFMPLFAAGMMFYRILKEGWTALRVGVILLGYATTWLSGNYLKASVVTVVLLVWALMVIHRLPTLWPNRLWQWLGARSYALYLVHMNVGFLLLTKLFPVTRSPVVSFIVAFAFVLTLSAILHRMVEVPAMSWARRATRKG